MPVGGVEPLCGPEWNARSRREAVEKIDPVLVKKSARTKYGVAISTLVDDVVDGGLVGHPLPTCSSLRRKSCLLSTTSSSVSVLYFRSGRRRRTNNDALDIFASLLVIATATCSLCM